MYVYTAICCLQCPGVSIAMSFNASPTDNACVMKLGTWTWNRSMYASVERWCRCKYIKAMSVKHTAFKCNSGPVYPSASLVGRGTTKHKTDWLCLSNHWSLVRSISIYNPREFSPFSPIMINRRLIVSVQQPLYFLISERKTTPVCNIRYHSRK